jgi:prephenate dehydrogenase
MHALIAGLGLIGGSAGMALRKEGWTISYVDPHVPMGEALRAGAADRRIERNALHGITADVVILATPVDVAVAMMDELKGTGVVTTVCSVMGPFAGSEVVAGHPMAGSQDHGLVAARPDLFSGKSWFVDRADARVTDVITACRGVEDVVDPDEHDRAMALTSHLPQLLSTALASLLEPALLRFAGSGLRTFLRLAGSESTVWRPVIDANHDAIAERTADLQGTLARILAGDDEAFVRATRLYDALTDAGALSRSRSHEDS